MEYNNHVLHNQTELTTLTYTVIDVSHQIQHTFIITISKINLNFQKEKCLINIYYYEKYCVIRAT